MCVVKSLMDLGPPVAESSASFLGQSAGMFEEDTRPSAGAEEFASVFFQSHVEPKRIACLSQGR